MTSMVDVCNLALQVLGTRTTITAAELASNGSNEAIQINLVYNRIRDRLLRMSPWDCAFNTANMVYITSVPGTPENVSPGVSTWAKGQPAPPWAYEYQYPIDCLRACWVTPQTTTGFASGVPITTAVTGGAPSFWRGPPVRFKVTIDQFFPVTAAAVAVGGAGHNVGDIITLAAGPNGSPPIGAPVQLAVVTTGGGGSVATVSVVNQIAGEATALGGSYFAVQANPVAQGSTTGVGSGATFNLTFGPQGDQRVILTNQEFAILNYVKQVTDENVWDPTFLEAFWKILGAQVCMALTGDKQLANLAIAEANQLIGQARKDDANEGMTVNDVTPDWIRTRGIWMTEGYSGPYNTGWGGMDWGGSWSSY